MSDVRKLLFEKADKTDLDKSNESKCNKIDVENIVQL